MSNQINKNLSLYTQLKICLARKGLGFDDVAREAGSTTGSVTKILYRIDEGQISPTGRRIIEAIKKLCPRSGLIKHIKSRS